MADHAGHDTHHVNYLLVFIVLCVFTAMSVVFDTFRPSSQALLAVLVLAVAVAKALCVMAFFMHLKFERNWKYVLLAPTIILAIGIPLALLPDVGVHYYAVSAPQEQELRTAIRELVKHEFDHSAEPLTDEQIRVKLKEQISFDVSAATVKQYREALGIESAELRKAE
jgi:cytochrome c oxidase subunit IV